jgi:hypothetical protein
LLLLLGPSSADTHRADELGNEAIVGEDVRGGEPHPLEENLDDDFLSKSKSIYAYNG